MPSKEQIFSKLLFLINAPAQRLVTVMNAVGRDVAVVLNQAVEQGKFAAAAGQAGSAEAAPVAEAPKAEPVAAAAPVEAARQPQPSGSSEQPRPPRRKQKQPAPAKIRKQQRRLPKRRPRAKSKVGHGFSRAAEFRRECRALALRYVLGFVSGHDFSRAVSE